MLSQSTLHFRPRIRTGARLALTLSLLLLACLAFSGSLYLPSLQPAQQCVEVQGCHNEQRSPSTLPVGCLVAASTSSSSSNSNSENDKRTRSASLSGDWVGAAAVDDNAAGDGDISSAAASHHHRRRPRRGARYPRSQWEGSESIDDTNRYGLTGGDTDSDGATDRAPRRDESDDLFPVYERDDSRRHSASDSEEDARRANRHESADGGNDNDNSASGGDDADDADAYTRSASYRHKIRWFNAFIRKYIADEPLKPNRLFDTRGGEFNHNNNNNNNDDGGGGGEDDDDEGVEGNEDDEDGSEDGISAHTGFAPSGAAGTAQHVFISHDGDDERYAACVTSSGGDATAASRCALNRSSSPPAASDEQEQQRQQQQQQQEGRRPRRRRTRGMRQEMLVRTPEEGLYPTLRELLHGLLVAAERQIEDDATAAAAPAEPDHQSSQPQPHTLDASAAMKPSVRQQSPRSGGTFRWFAGRPYRQGRRHELTWARCLPLLPVHTVQDVLRKLHHDEVSAAAVFGGLDTGGDDDEGEVGAEAGSAPQHSERTGTSGGGAAASSRPFGVFRRHSGSGSAAHSSSPNSSATPAAGDEALLTLIYAPHQFPSHNFVQWLETWVKTAVTLSLARWEHKYTPRDVHSVSAASSPSASALAFSRADAAHPPPPSLPRPQAARLVRQLFLDRCLSALDHSSIMLARRRASRRRDEGGARADPNRRRRGGAVDLTGELFARVKAGEGPAGAGPASARGGGGGGDAEPMESAYHYYLNLLTPAERQFVRDHDHRVKLAVVDAYFPMRKPNSGFLSLYSNTVVHEDFLHPPSQNARDHYPFNYTQLKENRQRYMEKVSAATAGESSEAGTTGAPTTATTTKPAPSPCSSANSTSTGSGAAAETPAVEPSMTDDWPEQVLFRYEALFDLVLREGTYMLSQDANLMAKAANGECGPASSSEPADGTPDNTRSIEQEDLDPVFVEKLRHFLTVGTTRTIVHPGDDPETARRKQLYANTALNTVHFRISRYVNYALMVLTNSYPSFIMPVSRYDSMVDHYPDAGGGGGATVSTGGKDTTIHRQNHTLRFPSASPPPPSPPSSPSSPSQSQYFRHPENNKFFLGHYGNITKDDILRYYHMYLTSPQPFLRVHPVGDIRSLIASHSYFFDRRGPSPGSANGTVPATQPPSTRDTAHGGGGGGSGGRADRTRTAAAHGSAHSGTLSKDHIERVILMWRCVWHGARARFKVPSSAVAASYFFNADTESSSPSGDKSQDPHNSSPACAAATAAAAAEGERGANTINGGAATPEQEAQRGADELIDLTLRSLGMSKRKDGHDDTSSNSTHCASNDSVNSTNTTISADSAGCTQHTSPHHHQQPQQRHRDSHHASSRPRAVSAERRGAAALVQVARLYSEVRRRERRLAEKIFSLPQLHRYKQQRFSTTSPSPSWLYEYLHGSGDDDDGRGESAPPRRGNRSASRRTKRKKKSTQRKRRNGEGEGPHASHAPAVAPVSSEDDEIHMSVADGDSYSMAFTTDMFYGRHEEYFRYFFEGRDDLLHEEWKRLDASQRPLALRHSASAPSGDGVGLKPSPLHPFTSPRVLETETEPATPSPSPLLVSSTSKSGTPDKSGTRDSAVSERNTASYARSTFRLVRRAMERLRHPKTSSLEEILSAVENSSESASLSGVPGVANHDRRGDDGSGTLVESQGDGGDEGEDRDGGDAEEGIDDDDDEEEEEEEQDDGDESEGESREPADHVSQETYFHHRKVVTEHGYFLGSRLSRLQYSPPALLFPLMYDQAANTHHRPLLLSPLLQRAVEQSEEHRVGANDEDDDWQDWEMDGDDDDNDDGAEDAEEGGARANGTTNARSAHGNTTARRRRRRALRHEERMKRYWAGNMDSDPTRTNPLHPSTPIVKCSSPFTFLYSTSSYFDDEPAAHNDRNGNSRPHTADGKRHTRGKNGTAEHALPPLPPPPPLCPISTRTNPYTSLAYHIHGESVTLEGPAHPTPLLRIMARQFIDPPVPPSRVLPSSPEGDRTAHVPLWLDKEKYGEVMERNRRELARFNARYQEHKRAWEMEFVQNYLRIYRRDAGQQRSTAAGQAAEDRDGAAIFTEEENNMIYAINMNNNMRDTLDEYRSREEYFFEHDMLLITFNDPAMRLFTNESLGGIAVFANASILHGARPRLNLSALFASSALPGSSSSPSSLSSSSASSSSAADSATSSSSPSLLSTASEDGVSASTHFLLSSTIPLSLSFYLRTPPRLFNNHVIIPLTLIVQALREEVLDSIMSDALAALSPPSSARAAGPDAPPFYRSGDDFYLRRAYLRHRRYCHSLPPPRPDLTDDEWEGWCHHPATRRASLAYAAAAAGSPDSPALDYRVTTADYERMWTYLQWKPNSMRTYLSLLERHPWRARARWLAGEAPEKAGGPSTASADAAAAAWQPTALLDDYISGSPRNKHVVLYLFYNRTADEHFRHTLMNRRRLRLGLRLQAMRRLARQANILLDVSRPRRSFPARGPQQSSAAAAAAAADPATPPLLLTDKYGDVMDVRTLGDIEYLDRMLSHSFRRYLLARSRHSFTVAPSRDTLVTGSAAAATVPARGNSEDAGPFAKDADHPSDGDDAPPSETTRGDEAAPSLG